MNIAKVSRVALPPKMLTILLCSGLLLLAQWVWAGDKSHAPVNFKNPIISGFHPDPSIVRVGDDYYLANSTFEWFPGMPIYHSRDLVNWQLIGHGLHRADQLTMQAGLEDYMGIFAPTLRYHDGLFYLITTCVRCEPKGGNFYITAKDPKGPWSDPVWLDSPGIDPSLMWDDDGKAYYVGHGNLSGKQEWLDQQGVWLQELDTQKGKLVGPRKQLTFGHANNAQWTEGPHLYKINGKYLLMVAEGGTGSWHSVTVHHSDDIWGPYVADMINPVLTHRHLGKKYPVHSVGHADLVQTQNNEWWSVMLGKRFVDGYTLLGRETFLAKVDFEDQTPIFNAGAGKLLTEQKRPDLPWSPVASKPTRDEFNDKQLSLDWTMLRTPTEPWYALDNGELILKTRPQTVSELANPSFLAKRIEHHNFSSAVAISFDSNTENEQAGLAVYRSSQCHYTLLKNKNSITLTKVLKGEKTQVAAVPFKGDEFVLAMQANRLDIQFKFGKNEKALQPIGGVESMATVSFENAGGFTGPFVGVYTTSNGQASNAKAVVDWFDYIPEKQ